MRGQPNLGLYIVQNRQNKSPLKKGKQVENMLKTKKFVKVCSLRFDDFFDKNFKFPILDF